MYSKTEERNEGLCQTRKRSVEFLPGVLEAHLESCHLLSALAILGGQAHLCVDPNKNVQLCQEHVTVIGTK